MKTETQEYSQRELQQLLAALGSYQARLSSVLDQVLHYGAESAAITSNVNKPQDIVAVKLALGGGEFVDLDI